MIFQIIQGDCLEVMKTLPDNHLSAIVTDPPYGLKFMGKDWDHGIPGIDFWKETLRISRPGSFLLSFGGTRTYHRLTCAIEDAGWEIRDCLMWIYGSGFPKSHNHFGIEGFGSALKPAYEPIIMAMKPCDGTFKQNAEKWGQSGINIDGCRIETNELKPYSPGIHKGLINDDDWKGREQVKQAPIGRWPANIIFDEEAAKILDEQSGTSKSSNCIRKNNRPIANCLGKYNPDETNGYSDSRGASRFFYCAKASRSERNEGLEGLEDKPSYMVENGSKTSGNNGKRYERTTICKNNHPTVKPLKLMEYLIKLVMPPKDGLLLDPFAGSGSTILAAKRLGFDAIGIEKSEEYCKISRKRVDSYKQQFEDQLDLF